ncbi:MAG TPA: hypothetical protein PLX59_05175, partial [Candidatus Cloacimonadota bacterium]|nr:hypothetical protein [Candidatus Cloacimonadota bacterium]
MSWLLGNFGNENIRSCCPESPEVVVEKPGFCLYAGGNPRTFTKHQLPNGDQVLVLGYPVYFDGNQYVNLTPDKLLDLMKLTDPTESLDGHYLILRIRGREIDVFNDKLGKRSLYIYQHGNRTLFTTHIAILR